MGKIFFHWTTNRVALLKIPSGSYVTKQWQTARDCLAEKSVCVSPRVSSEFLASSWLKFAFVGRVKARFGTSQNEGNLDSSSLLLGSINGPCEKGESCCRVFGLVWMKGSLTVFRMDLIFDSVFWFSTNKLRFFTASLNFRCIRWIGIYLPKEWMRLLLFHVFSAWLRKRQIFFTLFWDCEV